MLQLPVENIPRQEFRVNINQLNYSFTVIQLNGSIFIDVADEGVELFSGIRLTNNFVFTNFKFKGGLLIEILGEILGESIFLYYLDEAEVKEFNNA